MTQRIKVVGRELAILAIVGCAVVAAFAGCSIEDTMPVPNCASGGSVYIAAQSVPSASQVPCLDALPDGWSVASVSVNQARTRIVLDSDRAGDEAAVLAYEAACDVPTTAVESTSEHPATERFDDIVRLAPGFRASRFYRFDGGCLVWQFDFDQDASATEAVALGDALQLITRLDLSNQLARTFIGEGL